MTNTYVAAMGNVGMPFRVSMAATVKENTAWATNPIVMALEIPAGPTEAHTSCPQINQTSPIFAGDFSPFYWTQATMLSVKAKQMAT